MNKNQQKQKPCFVIFKGRVQGMYDHMEDAK